MTATPDTAAQPAPAPRTSKAAIASLIFGILSCIPFITSLIAIITGFIGLSHTKRPGVKGRGMAIAGLILGIFGIVWSFGALGMTVITVRMAAVRATLAQITATQTDVELLDGAVHTFEIDCGRYPTASEGLGALTTSPGDAKWSGPYLIRGIPLDSWGHPYIYRIPGLHNTDSFDIYSRGPSGQDGNADNIGNWKP